MGGDGPGSNFLQLQRDDYMAKCYKLLNLDKVYIEILHIMLVTFLTSLKLFQNKNFKRKIVKKQNVFCLL
jgi:hypothetical protein